MKVTLNWLKQYVDINMNVNELCEKLVHAGFEVEELRYLGEGFDNVVVGKIEAITKHPNADKLKVCQVNVGNEIIQIVTGAPNVNQGDVVPVALHNSSLPCGKHITKGKLRGIESNGMLCGGEEMCINNDVYHNSEVDGITILDACEPIGENIVKVLGLDDYLLDVSVTANRPDCGCVYGIAREIAAITKAPLKPIDTSYVADSSRMVSDFVKVTVKAPELCPNYSMSVVENVTIQPSPLWLTRRLHSVGLRGINNVVDITNYVLMELGQPMHAFDYADLAHKEIIVRRAVKGEKIIPLDEKEYVLNEEALLIADKKRGIGMAGIMGGLNSEIKASTSAVAFESAVFVKENIRRTSRLLGLRTDSSARFEKGLDSATSVVALNRALHLIQQLNCGTIVQGQINIGEFAATRHASFRVDKIQRLLGIDVPKEEIVGILNSLDIPSTIDGNELSCSIPPYRQDIVRDCDIAEEVIRLYGYSHIHPKLLDDTSITSGGLTPQDKLIGKLKTFLVGYGYSECVTYSFGGKALFDKLSVNGEADLSGNIRIKNPLGEELSIMRTTLAANILEVVATNNSRHNQQLKLFEVGKVYLADKLPITELPNENKRLCMATMGKDSFYVLKDCILDMLSVLQVKAQIVRSDCAYLHSGIAADFVLDGVKLGYVGCIHPVVAEHYDIPTNVALAELDLTALLSLAEGKVTYRPIPKFPSIDRDFSLIASDDVSASSILDVFYKCCKHCESAQVMDVYKGAQVAQGNKSVMVSVVFRGEQTLQDKDIEHEINKCLKALNTELGVALRDDKPKNPS